jgi:folate-binding protein YgfZ
MLAERWQKSAAGAELSAGSGPEAARLDDLSTLRFRGTDVENFLQGYLTVDLGRLADGEPHLASLTNLKGRVVASGWCCSRTPETVDWLIHQSLAESVAHFMSRYLAFSRTELSILAGDRLEVGLIDADGIPSAMVLTDPDEVDALLADHRIVAAATWAEACVRHGVVLVTEATSERFLPQMIGLVAAGAVDFDKGCYLGQEVVARAQHRGEVKRQLARLHGATAEILPGEPVLDATGKEQGTVLATAPPYCLAVLRQPPGDDYRAGDSTLTIDQS